MELKSLKTTLFGFSKKDVCEYIAQLNEEFSRKLREANEGKEKENGSIKQLQARLEKLETENSRLQSELAEKEATIEKLKKSLEDMEDDTLEISKNKAEVADILLDVKNFANSLREKAISENNAMRRKNLEYNQEIQGRLTAYKSYVEKIHEDIVTMLQNMDDSLKLTTAELSARQEKFDIEDEYNHD